MYIYYPSCNFSIASANTAKVVRNLLKETMPVAGCCKIDKREIQKDDIGVYICQNCRETIQDKVQTMSLWEYIDALDTFSYPNYHHEKMVLQDCWRDREHPEVHHAVRNLLEKMNIVLIEMKRNQDQSVYCGTLHYEPQSIELMQKVKAYSDMKISQLPMELQKELMNDNFRDVDLDLPIIVDCNRCLKGVELAERKGIHLLDLLMKNYM